LGLAIVVIPVFHLWRVVALVAGDDFGGSLLDWRIRGGLFGRIYLASTILNGCLCLKNAETVLVTSAILAACVIGVSVSPIVSALRSRALGQAMGSILFYYVTMLVLVVLFGPRLQAALIPDPLTWSVKSDVFFIKLIIVTSRALNFLFASKVRPLLLSFWVVSLASISVFANWLSSQSTTRSALNLRRKYYHILATIMFLPSYFLDVR
jgi:hypothetical protein